MKQQLTDTPAVQYLPVRTKLTVSEYGELKKRAIDAGLTVMDYVTELLRKHLAETGEKQ